jgi:hypothetical protein
MTFVGFNMHKRYITACALSGESEIIAEIRQLSTALETIVAWLDALPGPITEGLEATLYWEGLSEVHCTGQRALEARSARIYLMPFR